MWYLYSTSAHIFFKSICKQQEGKPMDLDDKTELVLFQILYVLSDF